MNKSTLDGILMIIEAGKWPIVTLVILLLVLWPKKKKSARGD